MADAGVPAITQADVLVWSFPIAAPNLLCAESSLYPSSAYSPLYRAVDNSLWRLRYDFKADVLCIEAVLHDSEVVSHTAQRTSTLIRYPGASLIPAWFRHVQVHVTLAAVGTAISSGESGSRHILTPSEHHVCDRTKGPRYPGAKGSITRSFKYTFRSQTRVMRLENFIPPEVIKIVREQACLQSNRAPPKFSHRERKTAQLFINHGRIQLLLEVIPCAPERAAQALLYSSMPPLARPLDLGIPGVIQKFSPCGLRNFGATCALNASIQLLFHAGPLRNAILHSALFMRPEGDRGAEVLSQTTEEVAAAYRRMCAMPPLELAAAVRGRPDEHGGEGSDPIHFLLTRQLREQIARFSGQQKMTQDTRSYEQVVALQHVFIQLLEQLIVSSQNGDGGPTPSTLELAQSLGIVSNNGLFEQRDAEELITNVLSACSTIPGLRSVFQIGMVDRRQIGNGAVRVEDVSVPILSVPIVGHLTLSEAIEERLAPEQTDVPGGKMRVTHEITSLPPVLFVSLQRVVPTPTGNRKLCGLLEFPKYLDMKQFTAKSKMPVFSGSDPDTDFTDFDFSINSVSSPPPLSGLDYGTEDQLDLVAERLRGVEASARSTTTYQLVSLFSRRGLKDERRHHYAKRDPEGYTLVGILSHIGSTESGHYITTACMRGDETLSRDEQLLHDRVISGALAHNREKVQRHATISDLFGEQPPPRETRTCSAASFQRPSWKCFNDSHVQTVSAKRAILGSYGIEYEPQMETLFEDFEDCGRRATQAMGEVMNNPFDPGQNTAYVLCYVRNSELEKQLSTKVEDSVALLNSIPPLTRLTTVHELLLRRDAAVRGIYAATRACISMATEASLWNVSGCGVVKSLTTAAYAIRANQDLDVAAQGDAADAVVQSGVPVSVFGRARVNSHLGLDSVREAVKEHLIRHRERLQTRIRELLAEYELPWSDIFCGVLSPFFAGADALSLQFRRFFVRINSTFRPGLALTAEEEASPLILNQSLRGRSPLLLATLSDQRAAHHAITVVLKGYFPDCLPVPNDSSAIQCLGTLQLDPQRPLRDAILYAWPLYLLGAQRVGVSGPDLLSLADQFRAQLEGGRELDMDFYEEVSHRRLGPLPVARTLGELKLRDGDVIVVQPTVPVAVRSHELHVLRGLTGSEITLAEFEPINGSEPTDEKPKHSWARLFRPIAVSVVADKRAMRTLTRGSSEVSLPDEVPDAASSPPTPDQSVGLILSDERLPETVFAEYTRLLNLLTVVLVPLTDRLASLAVQVGLLPDYLPRYLQHSTSVESLSDTDLLDRLCACGCLALGAPLMPHVEQPQSVRNCETAATALRESLRLDTTRAPTESSAPALAQLEVPWLSSDGMARAALATLRQAGVCGEHDHVALYRATSPQDYEAVAPVFRFTGCTDEQPAFNTKEEIDMMAPSAETVRALTGVNGSPAQLVVPPLPASLQASLDADARAMIRLVSQAAHFVPDTTLLKPKNKTAEPSKKKVAPFRACFFYRIVPAQSCFPFVWFGYGEPCPVARILAPIERPTLRGVFDYARAAFPPSLPGRFVLSRASQFGGAIRAGICEDMEALGALADESLDALAALCDGHHLPEPPSVDPLLPPVFWRLDFIPYTTTSCTVVHFTSPGFLSTPFAPVVIALADCSVPCDEAGEVDALRPAATYDDLRAAVASRFEIAASRRREAAAPDLWSDGPAGESDLFSFGPKFDPGLSLSSCPGFESVASWRLLLRGDEYTVQLDSFETENITTGALSDPDNAAVLNRRRFFSVVPPDLCEVDATPLVH